MSSELILVSKDTIYAAMILLHDLSMERNHPTPTTDAVVNDLRAALDDGPSQLTSIGYIDPSSGDRGSQRIYKQPLEMSDIEVFIVDAAESEPEGSD